MAALGFDSVSLTYEGSGRPVRALDAFSLDVAHGEPVAVIGPSGCGKSTMLLLAAGLLASSTGVIRVDGVSVTGTRRETALILQDYGLLPWKTVADNAGLGLQIRGISREERRRRAHEALERVGIGEFARAYPGELSGLGLQIRGISREERRRRAHEALERVGIGEFARAYPGELSGGMAQRLALARAVALDADLLLMDEPLSALDALTREDLQDVLLELWRSRGHAQVLVTHSIEEAVFLGRRIVVMTPRPGRVAAVVDNPEMGAEGYRASVAFYERCAKLRALLASEGALHSGGVSG